MTVATVIYYSGYHPYTLKPMETAKTKEEKQDQHKFFFWHKKENHGWIRNKLSKSNRPELVEKLLANSDEKKEIPKWLAEKRQQQNKRKGNKKR